MFRVPAIVAASLLLVMPQTLLAQSGSKAADKKLYCWNEGKERICSDALPADAVNHARDEFSANSGLRNAQVQRALSERRARARGGCRDRRHGAGWRADADKRAGRARLSRTIVSRGAPVAPVASGTQRGKHARAQAQARDTREEGKGTRRVERRWQRRVRFSEDFSGGRRLKQRSGRQRWTPKRL